MEYQYFACDWQIRPIIGFSHLTNFAKDINCELVIAGGVQETRKGFKILPLAVQVPSNAVLLEFTKKATELIGASTWYPTSKDQFLKGKSILELYHSPMTFSWFDALISNGVQNETLHDKLLYQDEENLFFACDWILNTKALAHLKDAHATALDLKCSLYRLDSSKSNLGFHVEILGIRVPSHKILREFVEQIGKNIGLQAWHPITQADFYQGIKFVGVYGIEEFMEVGHKFAVENERLSEKLHHHELDDSEDAS